MESITPLSRVALTSPLDYSPFEAMLILETESKFNLGVVMEAKTELVLPVIDASQEDWEERSNWEEEVRAAMASRTNFVVVFNPNGSGPQKLTNLLDCAPNALARLSRWGLHGLMDALTEEHYRWLASICGARDVRIVEQLNLLSNRPPQSKPYIVYCEIHGVVSDHDEPEAARAAYSAYLEHHPRAQRFPRSGVYHWEDQAWQPMGQETHS